MSAIAQEVSRRMTPGYAKERAKEMARDKAYEARDRAVQSSWLMPLVGAGIGALIGRAVLSRAQEKRDRAWHREEWARPAGYGPYERYRGSRFGEGGFSSDRAGDRAGQPPQGAHGASAEWDEGLPLATQEYGGDDGSPGLKEQLSQRASEVSDRATEMKERLGSKAEELSGRMSDKAHELGDRVRGQASALRERIPDGEAVRASAREQPALWALGAAAMGALFGFALPISDKERQVLEPAKQKMREATQQVMDKAVAKVEGQEEDEEGEEGDEETDLQATSGLGTSDSEFSGPRGPEPIH